MPAIAVLFTVPQPPAPHKATLVVLAAGLLIVVMFASITSAIGLAAVGAEQDATANLVPAVMFLAVAVSVSLVAVLAAFEVLAALYIQTSTTLFAVITAAAGLVGSFFTALSIADSWHTGPADPAVRAAWLPDQWLRTRRQADRQTVAVITAASVPAVAGMAVRIAGIHATPTPAVTTWLVASSLVLALGSVVRGAFRSRHPTDGSQQGLRGYEAYGTALSISLYSLLIVIYLPSGG